MKFIISNLNTVLKIKQVLKSCRDFIESKTVLNQVDKILLSETYQDFSNNLVKLYKISSAEGETAVVDLVEDIKDFLQEKEVDEFELDFGETVEMEHTDNAQEAREIAKVHLQEDPDYYKKYRLLYKTNSVETENDFEIFLDDGQNRESVQNSLRFIKQGLENIANFYKEKAFKKFADLGFKEEEIEPLWNKIYDALNHYLQPAYHNYAKWIYSILIDRSDKMKIEQFFDDIEFLTLEIKNYDTLKKRNLLPPDKKDLNSFKGFGEFISYVQKEVDAHPEIFDPKTIEDLKVKEGEDYKLLLDDSNWFIAILLTYKASCKFAKGSSFCTFAAGENDSYFKSYTSEGVIYFFKNKNTKMRYQYYLPDSHASRTLEIADENNDYKYSIAEFADILGEEYIPKFPELFQVNIDEKSGGTIIFYQDGSGVLITKD